MLKPKPQRSSPEALGDLCLEHLAENPEELAQFMVATGYTPTALRESLHSPHLAHALIDYIATNEPLLLAVCANRGIAPEQFMAVWAKLNPNG